MNNVCSIPHPQLYSVHSYKPKKPIYLLSMSPDVRIFKSVEFFACRVHNLHFEMINQIHISSKQCKFQANLYKYHNALKLKIISCID